MLAVGSDFPVSSWTICFPSSTFHATKTLCYLCCEASNSPIANSPYHSVCASVARLGWVIQPSRLAVECPWNWSLGLGENPHCNRMFFQQAVSGLLLRFHLPLPHLPAKPCHFWCQICPPGLRSLQLARPVAGLPRSDGHLTSASTCAGLFLPVLSLASDLSLLPAFLKLATPGDWPAMVQTGRSWILSHFYVTFVSLVHCTELC